MPAEDAVVPLFLRVFNGDIIEALSCHCCCGMQVLSAMRSQFG